MIAGIFLLLLIVDQVLRFILLANQNWGVESLKALLQTDHEIIHVFTHPQDMDRNEKVWYQSVKQECERNLVPVTERTNLLPEDAQFIIEKHPDAIFSLGWRRLIPRSIYEIPKYGSINIHEGLLPWYRGFAPTNWSVINGETEAGATVHFIDEHADTGDIILQRKVSILLEDTAIDVYRKTLSLFPGLLLDTIAMLESGSVNRINQREMGRGFYCARRFPKDGRIDWSQDRIKVYNLVRALCDPYPNAFCYLDSQKIYIKKAKLIDDDYRGPAGRVCAIRDDGVVVTCGDAYTKNQAILLTEVATEESTYRPRDLLKNLWVDLE